MQRLLRGGLGLLGCLTTLVVQAERAPEQKETADYIVTAKATKVFQRQEGRKREYLIELLLEEVHRGEALSLGDLLYAYCFQHQPVRIFHMASRTNLALPLLNARQDFHFQRSSSCDSTSLLSL